MRTCCADGKRRESRTRRPSRRGQLRRETDLSLPVSGIIIAKLCVSPPPMQPSTPPRVQTRNWISRCENTSPRGGPGYPRGRPTVDSRGETSVGQLNNRPPFTPNPLVLVYMVVTLQGDTSLRDAPSFLLPF